MSEEEHPNDLDFYVVHNPWLIVGKSPKLGLIPSPSKMGVSWYV